MILVSKLNGVIVNRCCQGLCVGFSFGSAWICRRAYGFWLCVIAYVFGDGFFPVLVSSPIFCRP